MISLVLQNPVLRAFARRAGLTRVGFDLIKHTLGDSQAETKFAKVLLKSVLPGDCVWDVGANSGTYTRQFAQRVGPTGRVIAFEPFEHLFKTLALETAFAPQVSCLRIALGAQEENLVIERPLPSVIPNLIRESDSVQGETIHVTTGKKLIADGWPRPAVLKLDVEGFEEDVIWGMREELCNSACRNVFVELHYGLLEKRGFLRAPERIVSLLRDLGFRTSWVDQAHLSARRA